MKRRGTALIIVLAFLVLLTFLVLAFFGTVSNEYSAAKITSDTEVGRQLAETSVQIVMSQIRSATSQKGATWSSQPGMIRTYDAGGKSDQVYSLYSSAQMNRSLAGAAFDPGQDLPTATWLTDTALWVDLNMPAPGRGGTGPMFPVIDPRAAGNTEAGSSLVEGFAYDVSAIAGAVAAGSSSDSNARLPMPVRWMYVLRDGTLTVPSGGSGTLATFLSPATEPTEANPIVGRIAFWTDDETCKLNVNTACGGVPWDTPIGNSGLEMLFARYQPAKNEFSRYPGHPATVSLTPALWSFLGMGTPGDTVFPYFTPNFDTTQAMSSGPSMSTAATAFRDRLFPLLPRNTFGGSSMSTRATAEVMTGTAALAAVDSDRLFASSDEILYGPGEGNALRNSNPLGLTASDVEKLKFFLTASSRAPEVNLFNLPKICLWPLPDASRKSVANGNAAANDTRSPVDRLIAFCSTLTYSQATKKREYGFTRYDSTSATKDFTATDASGTLNNEILYDYLNSLLGRPLPGFGGSFSSRYGAGGTKQILTGAYDFIRSEINLLDTSNSVTDPTSSQNLDGKFASHYAYAANITGGTLDSGGLAGNVGEVIPASLPNGTRGSGRFPVISQVAIEFIARAANQPPVEQNPMHPWIPSGTAVTAYPTFDVKNNVVANAFDSSRPNDFHTHPGLRYLTIPASSGGSYNVPNPRYTGPALDDYQTEVEPGLLISFSLPAAGIPGFRDKFGVRISGLSNLRANGAALFSEDNTVATVGSTTVNYEFNMGPSIFGAAKFYVGIPLIVGGTGNLGQTFAFGGGSFKIELLNLADNSVVQTYNLTFPATDLPTPLLPNPMPSDNRNTSSNSFWSGTIKPSFPPKSAADLPPSTLLTFNPASPLSLNPNTATGGGVSGYVANKTRRDSGSSVQYANMILPQWPLGTDYRGKLSSDTVRALEAPYGDSRILTQLANVPADFFLPHRFYFDKKMRAAHSFRDTQHESMFESMQGTTFQYLTPSAAIPASGLKTYGGAWKTTDPNPGDLWDVATGEDIQRLAYNIFVVGSSANTMADKWPFTASTCEFDAAKFAAYKASSSSLSGLADFATIWSRGGDFNSGIPGLMDGPLIGKVDEGNNRIADSGIYPYFNDRALTSIVPVGPNFFSPNRQVPSAVVFGSIPSGYKSTFDPAAPKLSDVTPWRTLLFSPNPAGQSHEALAEVALGGNVPQAEKAPDFTLLDFFWMPIVEPYAISEPLSTAGKVNMNAQIAPFTYITRETALRGVLRSALVTAVPDKWNKNKNATGSGSGQLSDIGGNSSSINYANFRYPINATETLKQFRARFTAGDIFRSASEICSLWLYPDKRSAADVAGPAWDPSGANIQSWWYSGPGQESKSVTGDNLREKPYATLYPLLSTKSNTYTVHFKVQTLQKVPGTPINQWNEGKDRITSEYQGSQTIERYLDPQDSALVDFATKTSASDPTLSDFYRFRVISNKRFSP